MMRLVDSTVGRLRTILPTRISSANMQTFYCSIWAMGNAERAIHYGKQALVLTPCPLAQQNLAAAYLSLSGQRLRKGQRELARDAFKLASKLGFNWNFVLSRCNRTCNEIASSIAAFQ